MRDALGIEDKPIQSRRSTRKTTFVIPGRGGKQLRFQLSAHNFVELLRFWNPKPENPAESEEVITIEYTSKVFRIRGNKEALDRLEQIECSCELFLVQQSKGADPDRDGDLSEPVVYGIDLIPKAGGKGGTVDVSKQIEQPTNLKQKAFGQP